MTPLPPSPDLPEMPPGYWPPLGKLMQSWVASGQVRMTDSARRVYWYRDVVRYRGWLNPDGYPCRGVQ